MIRASLKTYLNISLSNAQNEIKCWNDLSEYLRIIIFEAVEVGKW